MDAMCATFVNVVPGDGEKWPDAIANAGGPTARRKPARHLGATLRPFLTGGGAGGELP
jgi:hypothetical protein